MAALALDVRRRMRESHGLLIAILLLVTIAFGIWMYVHSVPLRWALFFVGGVIMTYKIGRISIEQRRGRRLKLREKILAAIYLAVLLAGAVYLYRQMTEIQRIFEMT